MQHRYFGDVGDFGKYGLLRILAGLDGEQLLRLGVVWYLYPDEAHNADGKYVHYLQKNDPAFRDCDKELYDKLRALLFDAFGRLIEANRHLSNAEKSRILPETTVFFSEPLAYPKELLIKARLALRNRWLADALTKTACADMVFLDPDNGIECASVKRTAKKGPKYAYWSDIDAFVERGQSVVIYHHLSRIGSYPEQVEDKLRQMNERFQNGFEASAVTFKRGASRAYFLIASPQHKDLFHQRLGKIGSRPWNLHFK
jgi:hypothetical protein